MSQSLNCGVLYASRGSCGCCFNAKTVAYVKMSWDVCRKTFKNRSFRKGVKLVIERTNDDLCSVITLLSYLPHCGKPSGLLFQWDNQMPPFKSRFVEHVYQVLMGLMEITFRSRALSTA